MTSASAAAGASGSATHLVDVRSYYCGNVEGCSESETQLVHITKLAVDCMLKYINNEDSRFERNPVGAGSQKQSLKVGKADEFDYNIKLRCDTSSWVWSEESVTAPSGGRSTSPATQDSCLTSSGLPPPPSNERCWQLSKVTKDPIATMDATLPPPPSKGRYWKLSKVIKDPIATMDATIKIVDVKLPLPLPRHGYTSVHVKCFSGDGASAVSWDDLSYKGDVTPFLVRRKLRKLMEQAIHRGKLLGIKFKLKRRLSGPALTFIITTAANEYISVDLVPFFDLPHLWPNGSNWPREKTKKWLPQTKIDEIKAKGVQLVPKRNFYWLISFNFAETELLDGIDTVNCCRKQSLRIVKQLSSTHCCKMTKPPVSSYLLKHLLLWECEEYPKDEQWSCDKLWERVLGISRRLLSCLEKKTAPHYFYPTINHLADKDPFEMQAIRKAVNKFTHNPSFFLNKTMRAL